MRFDVAVVGNSFLDLTFEGLQGLPAPGEEMLCEQLHFSPGGSAMTAIGAARLGLACALVSPIGHDTAGVYLRSILESEGVHWAGREVDRSALTAVMPWAEDRAMATFNPGDEPTGEDIAVVDAEALVISMGRLALVPAGRRLYAVTGFVEVGGEDCRIPEELFGAHTVVANEFEALRLTGAPDAAEAALKLGVAARTAVVTRGPAGAVAAHGGEVVHAPGLGVLARDTTGAGDLFVAAYVWADLQGASLRDRLEWANLYAGMSVRTYTPLAGAVAREELLRQGSERGLNMGSVDRREPR